MRHPGATIHTILAALVFLAMAARPSTAACLDGYMSAALATEPGFLGYYKYTLTTTWDLGRYDLGHLDFFLELENCECLCDDRFLIFGSSAGTSSDGGCVSQYAGEFVCMGDPSLPPSFWAPAVKFEPQGSCEPGLTGTGTFYFYSPMPPREVPLSPDGLAIKHGQEICVGSLYGQLPGCNCFLQQRSSTWGKVKSFYR